MTKEEARDAVAQGTRIFGFTDDTCYNSWADLQRHYYDATMPKGQFTAYEDQAMELYGKNQFDKGYSAAVANLISLHGTSTEAKETFKQHFDGMESLMKIDPSEFDVEHIGKLF